MKKFLAVYVGSASASGFAKWEALDAETRKKQESAGIAGWMNWGEKNARSIVDNGSPLGKTKRIGKDGISDIKNNLTGYTIVQAESHEAAAKMFVEHPHFMIFPGDSVEIMECLPLPNMDKK